MVRSCLTIYQITWGEGRKHVVAMVAVVVVVFTITILCISVVASITVHTSDNICLSAVADDASINH